MSAEAKSLDDDTEMKGVEGEEEKKGREPTLKKSKKADDQEEKPADATLDEVVTLVSKDGAKATLTRRQANLSILLKTMMIDKEADELPLPQLSSESLILVCEFLKRRNGVPLKPIASPVPSQNLVAHVHPENAEDAEWITRLSENNRQGLYGLNKEVNYLDIECLFDLIAARIGANMQGVGWKGLRAAVEGNCKDPVALAQSAAIWNEIAPSIPSSSSASSSSSSSSSGSK